MSGSLINKGNNKWELRVSLGYDENHKQKRYTKTIYAKTKKEANKQLADFYLKVTGKLVMDKEIKFSEFVTYWKQRYSKKVSDSTMYNYEQMLNDRILPAFGHMPLDKITDADILRFMDHLSGKNTRLDQKGKTMLSTVTIIKHFKLLKLILNRACEWKYLQKNPCNDVPKDLLVTAKSKHYPIWSGEQLKQFMKILDTYSTTYTNLKHKLIFYIAITTGARRGEIFGLTWDCIDLDNLSLRINKAMKYLPSQEPVLGKPKTEASSRTLYFDDYLKQLFEHYRAKQDKLLREKCITNPMGYVFTSRDPNAAMEAQPINGDSFYLWLKRMCTKHNLPRIAVHSLRAMAATHALISGIPLNMVQAMMGHTNISTTSIYLRDVQDERKNAVVLLANHLDNLRN